MSDILHDIIKDKRKEVESLKSVIPYKVLEQKLSQYKSSAKPLSDALIESKTGIIAEFKRRSPSKGWMNKDAEAKNVVGLYQQGGAAAISVLTDEKYFGGVMRDLEVTTSMVQIPVLRKDFIVDEYQIIEAKLSGASAILLIAASLTQEEVVRFTRFATDLGLDTLLELHDEREIEYIRPENKIIGVNNRNLGTFETSIERSFKMAEMLPKDAILVAESGISSPSTVSELKGVGYKGFLIGETFMKEDNPGEALLNFISNIK